MQGAWGRDRTRTGEPEEPVSGFAHLPPLPFPSLFPCTQNAWPGAGHLGLVSGSANVLGVWGLFRDRVWVSASGVTVGVDSGKLGVGKTLTFGAVKGCPGMAGLGA